jgi:hypothetical protein
MKTRRRTGRVGAAIARVDIQVYSITQPVSFSVTTIWGSPWPCYRAAPHGALDLGQLQLRPPILHRARGSRPPPSRFRGRSRVFASPILSRFPIPAAWPKSASGCPFRCRSALCFRSSRQRSHARPSRFAPRSAATPRPPAPSRAPLNKLRRACRYHRGERCRPRRGSCPPGPRSIQAGFFLDWTSDAPIQSAHRSTRFHRPY